LFNNFRNTLHQLIVCLGKAVVIIEIPVAGLFLSMDSAFGHSYHLEGSL